MNDDQMNQQPGQPQSANNQSDQPIRPAMNYSEMPQKVIRNGSMILSFVAMATSFFNLFKKFSGKK